MAPEPPKMAYANATANGDQKISEEDVPAQESPNSYLRHLKDVNYVLDKLRSNRSRFLLDAVHRKRQGLGTKEEPLGMIERTFFSPLRVNEEQPQEKQQTQQRRWHTQEEIHEKSQGRQQASADDCDSPLREHSGSLYFEKLSGESSMSGEDVLSLGDVDRVDNSCKEEVRKITSQTAALINDEERAAAAERLNSGSSRLPLRSQLTLASVTAIGDYLDTYLAELLLPMLHDGLVELCRVLEYKLADKSMKRLGDKFHARFDPLCWLSQFLVRYHPRKEQPPHARTRQRISKMISCSRTCMSTQFEDAQGKANGDNSTAKLERKADLYNIELENEGVENNLKSERVLPAKQETAVLGEAAAKAKIAVCGVQERFYQRYAAFYDIITDIVDEERVRRDFLLRREEVKHVFDAFLVEKREQKSRSRRENDSISGSVNRRRRRECSTASEVASHWEQRLSLTGNRCISTCELTRRPAPATGTSNNGEKATNCALGTDKGEDSRNVCVGVDTVIAGEATVLNTVEQIAHEQPQGHEAKCCVSVYDFETLVERLDLFWCMEGRLIKQFQESLSPATVATEQADVIQYLLPQLSNEFSVEDPEDVQSEEFWIFMKCYTELCSWIRRELFNKSRGNMHVKHEASARDRLVQQLVRRKLIVALDRDEDEEDTIASNVAVPAGQQQRQPQSLSEEIDEKD